MNGYSWISIVSILCYLFLLMSFISQKKPKRVIRSFMSMLGIMILWNGGSLCMRMQLWPSVNFWHHVSLLGMIMLAVGYFHFMLDFLDEKNPHGRNFWIVFYAAIFLVNCATGFFVPLPEVTVIGKETQFLYHYSWHIYLLFGSILLTLLQLSTIIYRHCRGNHIAFRQLRPVIYGMVIMLLGHALATLPNFTGLPLDMLSGAINTVFLFYAMYKKKLFHIAILSSRYTYGIIAVFAGIIIFSYAAPTAQQLLIQHLNMGELGALILVMLFLLLSVAVLYFLIKVLLNVAFSRNERRQKELIASFSEEITHMLSLEDILLVFSETILKTVDVDRLFILVRNNTGAFHIEHTIRPLEGKNFYFSADHPLVTYYNNHNGCLLMQDFLRTTSYRSMWEKEKDLLASLQIEYVIPIKSDDELIALTILSGKQGKSAYHPNNDWFFETITDTAAGIIKNASTFETALNEARRDNLTGLINYRFFFEILEREFEACKDTALSLCIINIDDFKTYNQMYGTQEGDLALQRIAGVLLASISESAYASRINGDEFALILPNCDIYSAKCLAENVAAQIGEIHPVIGGCEDGRKLTASIGICAAPYMAASARELYRNTDMTVYTVKRSGKNAVQMYSAEIFPSKNNARPHKSGYAENASTIYALSAAIDAKDHYTFKHSQNVAYYASALTKAMNMDDDMVEIVKEAALLHDIGKIGVREDILNKPSKLTTDEYDAIKKHVENAVNIIRYLPSLDYVIPAVRSHHERFDGTGYPNRLAADNIPITGRILCIADSFDAMLSERNYKPAMRVTDAIKILRYESGKQFDPILVRTFTELIESGSLKIPNLKSAEDLSEQTMQN